MKSVPDHPERDPELSAAWREHSTEMPSAATDAAVLSAAHRAAGSAPRDAGKPAAEATSPQRWWMPLAAAATIGAVAVGILQSMQQESPVTAPTASDMPARSTEPTTAPPSAPANKLVATERNDAPRAAAESAAPQIRAMPAPHVAAESAAPATTPMRSAAKVVAPHASDNVAPSPASIAAAPQPFPAEKKSESAESADIKDRARAAPTPAGAPAVAQTSELARTDVRRQNETPASAPAASGAVTMAKNMARADTPSAADVDAWIVRIRKLHDDGKLADAAKELIAFRAAVPDADGRLPPELRAWAATVRP